MAKNTTDTPADNPPASTPAASDGQRQPVQIEDSRAVAGYANFCRVMGTPEEVILDLGLNPNPFGPATEPIHVTQRIIVNYYTAKRMLAALQYTLQRHEAAFGVLETDVQKRVIRPRT